MTRLANAVSKLTPERARRALAAWKQLPNQESTSTWFACPLALAYGKPGQLVSKADRRGVQIFSLACSALSLQPREAVEIMIAFDSKGADSEALRQLLAERATQ